MRFKSTSPLISTWIKVHGFVTEGMTISSVDGESKKQSSKENQRTAKRRQTLVALQDSRDELFAGEWDGYVVAFC